ncbi:MAG: glutathione S-transferase family protein [Alphaproteobacteria bacterium]|nr:glutathione S-transferase family protein [Alphaproteobacteria bacterium]
MQLYHAPKAVNPERTYNFLKAKGKLDAVEIKEISIMKGEHKSREYRELSPFAQVPVLILDDGTKITESRAICTYFEGVFPEPNLMGNDPKEKALIEMWDRRIEFMFMMQFAAWFRNAHPMMAPLENPQLPEAGAKAEASVRKFVKRLDAHLGEQEWMAAGRFSIADITTYLTCGFCNVMQWQPYKEFENLSRHYGAVKAKLG